MSLSQFWVGQNRKDLAERALVSRREQIAHHDHQCELAAKYHRDLNLLSTQYKNIEDNPSGKIQKVNQESRKEEELRAKRKEKLHHRQHQLKLLLDKENDQLLEELKVWLAQVKEKDPWSISTLRREIEELKKERLEQEELMKKSAANKFFSSKLPFVKEHEESLKYKESLAALEERKKVLEKQMVDRQSKQNQKKEMLEKQLEEARLTLEEAIAEKIETSNVLKESLKQHLKALEENKLKCQGHKFDMEILDHYEEIVNGVSQKRCEITQIQQERMEKISYFRPSKEKIRKMCIEVTHLLNADLTSLNFLYGIMEKPARPSVAICLDDVIAAKESIAEKLAQEASRSADVQNLFEEEAAKLWKEWKATWDEILKNHEEMMKEVLISVAGKVQEKKKDCLQHQESVVASQKVFLDMLKADEEKLHSSMREFGDKEESLRNNVKRLEEKLKKFESGMAFALTQT